jgi:uncharacterized protein DUF1543
MKLFMVMLGATPPGRFTEQHDIFFGIGNSLKELVPHMQDFWPEALGKIHIDAWREVTQSDGYRIEVIPKKETADDKHLFFINLGGYRQDEFEEYHYKVLAVGATLAEASKKSKQTAFFKHCGFKGAESHIDDKFGIDVDDIYKVEDILPEIFSKQFSLKLTENQEAVTDELHIGYVKIEKLLKQ